MNQNICMKEFVPEKALCKKDSNKGYELNSVDDGIYLNLGYEVDTNNQFGCSGKRCFSLALPKYINRNLETFEVLGLLQAEMGKQHDGKIVFCNHEHRLVNKVIIWFEKEFNLLKDVWKWYVKVNINEPLDHKYRREVEEKVITYWIKKSGLSLQQAYPKKVSYIKNTMNKKLRFYDYGTLIIDYASNLFSQIIKNFVKEMTNDMLLYEKCEIRAFLRGILAGESCVEIHNPSKKFRVHLSVTNEDEKLIYHNCLIKLGVNNIIYPLDKLVISKKENNLELLKQKLMTLSPKKYNKFLRMMSLYNDFEGLKEWRYNLQKPYNKVPQKKINKIVRLHNRHPDWPAWKMAEQVGVSAIKVQRVRKESDLGVGRPKTPKYIIAKIIEIHNQNPSLHAYEIAELLGVHVNVVWRIRGKYKLKKKAF